MEDKFFLHRIRKDGDTYTTGIEVHDTLDAAKRSIIFVTTETLIPKALKYKANIAQLAVPSIHIWNTAMEILSSQI